MYKAVQAWLTPTLISWEIARFPRIPAVLAWIAELEDLAIALLSVRTSDYKRF